MNTHVSNFQRAEKMHSTVGVVGAGVMGRDIAEAIASYGYKILLIDLDATVLKSAENHIRRNLRWSAISKKLPSESVEETTTRISFSTDYSILQHADFIIENVSEALHAKTSAYSQLDRFCHVDTVIAANTSTYPIGELSQLIRAPERIVGIHFMNPATEKPMVEVIAGANTSAAALQRAMRFLGDIGKTGIIVKDAPGFVSNRVLMLTVNEAIQVVEAGTASAEDVDRIFVGCFGHTMGPLATADLIGLDTIQLSLESLLTHYNDSKFEPAALLKKMTAEGRLGRKTRQGFFTYGV